MVPKGLETHQIPSRGGRNPIFQECVLFCCRHGISLKLPVHNETTYFVQILWQTVRENPAKKKNRTSRYSLEIGASIVGKFLAFTGE